MRLSRHLPLLAALATPPLAAQPFEDLAALDARLSQVDGGTVQPLDKRLKLAACPEPAMIDAPALGAIAIRCPALGWRVRVPLIAVAVAKTKPQIIVRRGDIVALKIVGDGFELTTSGTAIDEAAAGDSLRIKPATSTTAMTATAIAPGSVEAVR